MGAKETRSKNEDLFIGWEDWSEGALDFDVGLLITRGPVLIS